MQSASFTHSALLKVPLMTNGGGGGQRARQMALASLQVCCSSGGAQKHDRKISVFGADRGAAETFWSCDGLTVTSCRLAVTLQTKAVARCLKSSSTHFSLFPGTADVKTSLVDPETQKQTFDKGD